MRTFKDSQGRFWTVEVNVTAIKIVRALASIDLYRLFNDGCKGFAELMADPVRLVDVLYCLCRNECDLRGLTDEDFGRLMAGDVLEEATEAFVESLTDFFPSPTTRKAIAGIVAKGRRVTAILGEQALEKVSEIDPEALAKSAIQSSEPSGDSPGSSGYTRDPSPSAN